VKRLLSDWQTPTGISFNELAPLRPLDIKIPGDVRPGKGTGTPLSRMRKRKTKRKGNSQREASTGHLLDRFRKKRDPDGTGKGVGGKGGTSTEKS